MAESAGLVAVYRELLVVQHQLAEQLDLLDLIVRRLPKPIDALASMRSISASTGAICANASDESTVLLSCVRGCAPGASAPSKMATVAAAIKEGARANLMD